MISNDRPSLRDPLNYRDFKGCEENDLLLKNEHPENWVNPTPRSCYDLLVIGGGPAGMVSALTAVSKGASVALIERDLLGGECLNIGCIPSKAIIRTSRLYADMRNAHIYGGVVPPHIEVNFSTVMERMRRVRAQVSRRVAVNELQKKKIDVFFGHGRFSGPRQIKVDDQDIHFKKAIIATGSRPQIPDIPGLDSVDFLTNETVFNLETLPESLLVIGGGAVGCELAQAFARLGSRVTIVQTEPMFLDNVERDGAQILSDALAHDGINIHLNSDVVCIRPNGNLKTVDIVNTGDKTTISVQTILVGIGQTPNTSDLGLNAAEIRHDASGSILVNDYLCTTNKAVYAVGNVCGEERYVHIPDALARIATANALSNARQKVDHYTIPWCIYTDPEIAHVGIQVKEARELAIPVKTFTVLMHQVDRAIADTEDVGFVKIHVREGTDTILGATVVSRHAGDIMSSVSLALQSGMGLSQLAGINYPYPTQGDVLKVAAMACRNEAPKSIFAPLQTLIASYRKKNVSQSL